MLNSLDNGQFFSEYEIERLRDLGLWQESHTTPGKLAFGGLMLAPVMQVDMSDSLTSAAEFTTIEEFMKRIEVEFEIATEDDLESIGTEMGLLPMVPATWDKDKFLTARAMLSGALERMTEPEANHVRNALSKAILAIARVGSGHILGLHHITKQERPLIHEIVHELRLETTGEGLHLLEKTQ